MVINFFHKLISKETLDDDSLQETVVNESEIITDDVQPKSKMLIKSYTGQKRFKAQRALRSVAHNLSFPQAIITLREGGEIDILEDINNLSDHYQTLQKAGINFELIV